MGEAKRRRQLDPTWGKNIVNLIEVILFSEENAPPMLKEMYMDEDSSPPQEKHFCMGALRLEDELYECFFFPKREGHLIETDYIMFVEYGRKTPALSESDEVALKRKITRTLLERIDLVTLETLIENRPQFYSEEFKY